MKKPISTAEAPATIGPYSQAVLSSGQLLFISGQLPIDPSTGEFAGEGIEEQTEQSLKNIQAILKKAGMTMENVVQTTVMLSRISDFEAMNRIYAKYFISEFPARAAYQVAALPKQALVEIQAVAVLEKE